MSAPGYTFRPAERASTKPLIGIYSESGCGKTWSSLLLARGFVGPAGKIGMIETESGRGEVYVGAPPVGDYLVCPIRDDFAPQEYGKALTAAEAAGLDALIIDSASHEWEGANGVLSMAADNEASGKKGPLVWQRPKMDHARHFVLRIMQTPIPLVIVNMRAKYPMEQKLVNGKKDWCRSEDLSPKQSEDILFEMFAHGWIDKEHRFHVTKYPQAIASFRDVLRDGEPITVETGQRLADWAKGRAAPALGTQSVPSARPERTERHNSMVADFEVVAREQGFAAFKASWGRLPTEDRAAIGTAERDRIGSIGQAHDQSNKETN